MHPIYVMLNVPPLQLLEEMLISSKWSHLASYLDEGKRQEFVGFWHKLNGPYLAKLSLCRLIFTHAHSRVAGQ